MSSRLHFYATQADLESVIRKVEETASFRYALTGLHPTPSYPTYNSAIEIPDLGHATADSSMGCKSYLVLRHGQKIAVRKIPQNAGGARHAVDQLANPDSIIFQPAGISGNATVIHGRIATTGTTIEAKTIFATFQRHFRKYFAKHAAFYVGPEAMQLREKGFRLTMAIQSPPEFDLA
jgi:hypothetical protein